MDGQPFLPVDVYVPPSRTITPPPRSDRIAALLALVTVRFVP